MKRPVIARPLRSRCRGYWNDHSLFYGEVSHAFIRSSRRHRYGNRFRRL